VEDRLLQRLRGLRRLSALACRFDDAGQQLPQDPVGFDVLFVDGQRGARGLLRVRPLVAAIVEPRNLGLDLCGRRRGAARAAWLLPSDS
jgi:hypothetical protein